MAPPSPYSAHLDEEAVQGGTAPAARSQGKGYLAPQPTLYFETFGLVCFLQKREGMEVH